MANQLFSSILEEMLGSLNSRIARMIVVRPLTDVDSRGIARQREDDDERKIMLPRKGSWYPPAAASLIQRHPASSNRPREGQRQTKAVIGVPKTRRQRAARRTSAKLDPVTP